MKIVLKTNRRNRFIGTYDAEKNTFTKVVRVSKHLFRKLDAFGIDGYYFREVLLPNNTLIKVLDKDERVEYLIRAEDFNKHGQYYHFNKDGEDNKAQIFCPRRNFLKSEILPKKVDEEKRVEELAKNGFL